MYQNKKDNDWILCSSKTTPGKFYYFNVRNGEAVWTHEAKNNSNNNPSDFQNLYQKTIYHEPKEPDSVKFTNQFSNIGQTFHSMSNSNPSLFSPNAQPRFYTHHYDQNIFWLPIAVTPMFSPEPIKQEYERDISVHALPVPLSSHFKSVQEPKRTINMQNTPNLFVTSTPTGKRINVPTSLSKNSNKPVQKDKVLATNPIFDINIKSTDCGIQFSYNDNMKQAIMYDSAVKSDKCTQTNTLEGNLSKDYEICTRIPQFSKRSMPNISELTESFKFNLDMDNRKNIISPIPVNEPINTNKEKRNLTYTDNAGLMSITKQAANSKACSQKIDPIPIYKETETKTKNSEETNTFTPKEYNMEFGDLRQLLNARKRSKPPTSDDNVSKPQDVDQLPQKKRVMFYDNYVENNGGNHEELPQCNKTTNNDPIFNSDSFNSRNIQAGSYIIVELDVLFENLDLILAFVREDEGNILFIPRFMSEVVESIALGDSRGRQHAAAARRIFRLIASPPPYVVVQNVDTVYGAIEETDPILSCCLHLQSLDCRVMVISDKPNTLIHLKSYHVTCYIWNDVLKYLMSTETKFCREINNFIDKSRDEIDNNKNTIDKRKDIIDNKENRTDYNYGFDNGLSFTSDYKDELDNIRNVKNMFFEKSGNLKTFAALANSNLNSRENSSVLNNENILFSNKVTKDLGIERLPMKVWSIDANLMRFSIENKELEEKISMRIDEWICCLSQIMEEALKHVLKDVKAMKNISQIGSLTEYFQCVLTVYKDSNKVQIITKKILRLLEDNMTTKAKFKPNMKSKDIITITGCCLLLIEELRNIHNGNQQLLDAEVALNKMLNNIQNDEFDNFVSPPRNILPAGEIKEKKNFTKDLSYVNDYIQNHFLSKTNNEEPLDLNGNTTYHTDKDPKIFRTVGKYLKTVKIDNMNTMTLDDDNKTADRNLKDTKISIITNNTIDNDNNKIIENITINKNNDKYRDGDFKMDLGKAFDTVDCVNEINAGNTFGTTKGPQIVRNIKIMDTYENKINKTQLDIDNYDNISNETGNAKGKGLNDSAFANDSPASNDLLINRENRDKSKRVKVKINIISNYNKMNYGNISNDGSTTDDSGYSNETSKRNPFKAVIVRLKLAFTYVVEFIKKTRNAINSGKLLENDKVKMNRKTQLCKKLLETILEDLNRIKKREESDEANVLNLYSISNNLEDEGLHKVITKYIMYINNSHIIAVGLRNTLNLLLNYVCNQCDKN